MKKKLLYINLVLMLAVIFAACYQSLHTFSHKHRQTLACYEDSKHVTFKTSDKTFLESDDCPICDLKFVAFLSPEIFCFDFIPQFYEIPYQFNKGEIAITFEGNSIYLRGPPILV